MNQLQFFLLFYAFMVLFPSSNFAQSVTVTGPSTVEVGIAATYTATFDNGGNPSIQIISFEWSVPFVGIGISGSSGIIGSINGNISNNPLTISSNINTSTVPIIWSDFFDNSFDEVMVTAHFKKDGSTNQVNDKTNVTIKRVCTPAISGVASIQKCCTAPFTFSASACDGDAFNWTITAGGTITAGNGTPTISVIPSLNNDFMVICVARRSTGLANYTRTNTKIVTRYLPVTPAINALSYFCSGSNYDVSVATICGLSGVNWNVPSSLQIVSGQGTANIVVKPTPGTVGGTTGIITAQATLTGGCTVSLSQRNFTIYGAEIPPVPVGYITLQLDSGDACHDPVYTVVWHTTQPYLNGYTSVSPGTVLGGNHPIGSGGVASKIKIRVCNTNLCSGKSSCISFTIDRPYPCIEPLLGGGAKTTPKTISEERNTKQTVSNLNKIAVYPNPTNSGRFYISCPSCDARKADLFDCTGKWIGSQEIDVTSNVTEFTGATLEKGLYFLQIRLVNETITTKIAVQ